MKYYAIIVAGGTGTRMNSAIAKQFLLLDGKPVLMHTIAKFHECVLNPEIILVLNIHQHQYWEDLCEQYDFQIPHTLVKGGIQRFHSVQNGLKTIKGKGIVAVHDAVRPLVSARLILESYKLAEEKGTAVAGIKPTDSVRMIDGQGSKALKRDHLFLIQTPQTFDVTALKKAYKSGYRNDFTDDASVAEFAGMEVFIIPGERDNIKITHAEDLQVAALLIKKRASE